MAKTGEELGKVKKTKSWTDKTGGGLRKMIGRLNTDDLEVMVVNGAAKFAFGSNDDGETFWCRVYDDEHEGTASRFNLENAVYAAWGMYAEKKGIDKWNV